MTDKELNPSMNEAERSFKNFRTISEIENFYRFVHENDMRREALMALSAIVGKVQGKKKRSRSKKH